MAESNLKINITGDSSKLNNALSSASSKLQAFGSKMQSVGRSMSTKLTLPLVAAGTAATKLALDFDKSMTQIESLVGIAAGEVAKMGEAAKTMATETGRSANEAGEALFFITSAGLRGAEATNVLNASLKAAAVGLGETKTIADLATSAMNAYGVENLNATGATDILVAAVREGKLEASELAGAMGGVIPIASNMGVGFDEVGAALAAMSRTGTNAAVGATQLTAILASIKKPTMQSAEAMLALGTSQEQIAQSLEQKGLMPTLLDLSARLKATGMDASAIFPNIRALKGVLDLTGKGAEDNVKIFDALSNTMGATDEAFQKTSESASFKFAQGMATMKNSLMEIGQIVLPAVIKAVTKLSSFIKGLSDSFKNLSPQTQNIILTLTGILAAAGPLLVIFGKLMTGISALGPILKIAAVGFRLLTTAMLANPILAVAAAIAAVVLALRNYKKAQNEAMAASIGKLDIVQVNEDLKNSENELAELEAKRSRISLGAYKQNKQRLEENITLLKERKSVLEQQAAAESQQVAAPTQDEGAGFDFEALLEKHKQANQQIVENDKETAQQRKEVKAANVLEMQGIDASAKEQQITSDAEFNAIQTETEAANYEAKKIRFMDFMMSMQTATELAQKIGQQVDASFGMIGNAITNMFGGAQSALGAFVGTLAKDALKIIGHNLKVAMSEGVAGASMTAKSFGPAAAFVLPALIAGTTALISGTFAKFADGGIVSGPTMGLVGEYPGARQNPEVIAPLNKLQSMIGGSGGGNVNVTGSVRVEGQDLLIAIERANETAGRIY